MKLVLILIIITASKSVLGSPTLTAKQSKYKSFIKYPLSAGLPEALSTLNMKLKRTNKNDYIYLIVHHPEKNLLHYSTSSIKDLLIIDEKVSLDTGHIQIAWSCKLKGKIIESATGFTGDQNNKSIMLAKNGFGYSPLVMTFQDGVLEPPRIVNERIQKSMKKNKLSIIAINANKNCNKVLKNIWRFANSPKNHLFQIAQIIQAKSSPHNCTTLVIDWLTPLSKFHKLIKDKSAQKLKLPIEHFGNPKHIKVVKKELLPSQLKGIRKKVSLVSLLRKPIKAEYLELILYSPATLINNFPDNQYPNTTFVYEGIKNNVILL